MLAELRKGGTNAEIAVRLGRSAETVRMHIASMLSKLDLAVRHQLAAWRPERERKRLLGLVALPSALGSVGRPLVWAGRLTRLATALTLAIFALGACGTTELPKAPSPTPIAPTNPVAVPMAPAPPPNGNDLGGLQMFQVGCGREAFYVMQVPSGLSVSMVVREEQALNIPRETDDEQIADRPRLWRLWQVWFVSKRENMMVGVFESAFPCGQRASLRVLHDAHWLEPVEGIIGSFHLRTEIPFLLPEATENKW